MTDWFFMPEQNSFSQIFDSLITAVIVIDEQLSVVHLNAAAEVLLCVSAKQMKGRRIDQCFTEAGQIPVSLQSVLKKNQRYTKRKARWLRHDNNEITVDYSVSPNVDNKHIIMEVQPLDRLLRISREEAWLSSQETSKNLVRSLAHEIKNPLGGIRGAAQLLSKELVSKGFDEYTHIIIEETDRLRNLVDRMLGPISPAQFEETNIHEILEYVSSVIRLEAQDSVAIKRDYDPSIPELICDKEQLIQAVLNIVRNAFQALTETNIDYDGAITMRTRIQRRHTLGRRYYPLVAKISIIDNGPGIPSDLIEDIFFPMITGRATGSGLGLAISQNLVSQHRGLIECTSEPGKTRFDIFLPLGKDYEQA